VSALAGKERRIKEQLVDVLLSIMRNDDNYEVRNPLVYQALALASRLGCPVGIRIDPAEPEFPVVYIELPTGQISWHLPQHPTVWDGHSTEDKFDRIRRYLHAGWKETRPVDKEPGDVRGDTPGSAGVGQGRGGGYQQLGLEEGLQERRPPERQEVEQEVGPVYGQARFG
jgi:hypothetical protein